MLHVVFLRWEVLVVLQPPATNTHILVTLMHQPPHPVLYHLTGPQQEILQLVFLR
jgi:hypothetical protein